MATTMAELDGRPAGAVFRGRCRRRGAKRRKVSTATIAAWSAGVLFGLLMLRQMM